MMTELPFFRELFLQGKAKQLREKQAIIFAVQSSICSCIQSLIQQHRKIKNWVRQMDHLTAEVTQSMPC